MPSAINPLLPADLVAANKADLRANLAAAKAEIETLQARFQGVGTATGDGETNDTAALNAVVATGRLVHVPAGTYHLSGGHISVLSGGLAGEGRGTVLRAANGAFPINRAITVQSSSSAESGFAFTGAISAGQRTVTVAGVIGLQVGDPVVLLLGTDPFDGLEELLRLIARVTEIDGNDITIDRGVPEDVPDATHELWIMDSLSEGVVIRDLAIDYDLSTVPDQMIILQYVRGCEIHNVYAVNTSGSVVDVRESENVSVHDVYQERSIFAHGAAGRCITVWGSRNCSLRNIFTASSVRTAIFLESQCRNIIIDGLAVMVDPLVEDGTAVIHVAGGSKGITIRNYEYSDPTESTLALNVIQDSEVTTENVYLYTDTRQFHLGFIEHRGDLLYKGSNYRHRAVLTRRVPISPNMSSVVFELPAGLWQRATFLVSSTTGLSSVFVTNDVSAGSDIVSSLITATPVTLAYQLGNVYPFNNEDGKWLTVSTDGAAPIGTLDITVAVYKSTAELEPQWEIYGGPAVPIDTGAKTYTSADNGEFRLTGGTQTFGAAAGFSAGFSVNLFRETAGTITIDGADADYTISGPDAVTVKKVGTALLAVGKAGVVVLDAA